jgi:hypothetical protein
MLVVPSWLNVNDSMCLPDMSRFIDSNMSSQNQASVFSLGLVAQGTANELRRDVQCAEWKWRRDKKENHGSPKRRSVGRRKGHDGTYQPREHEQTREPCNNRRDQPTRCAVGRSFGPPCKKVPNEDCNYTSREGRQHRYVVKVVDTVPVRGLSEYATLAALSARCRGSC